MGHIFISYSHRDTDYAQRLANSLQSVGFNVWIDERLDYGSQWPHELQTRLDSCDAFILIMTSRSYASEWVQNELQRAKRKLKPIFPLLLEGDEPWLSVESTQYYDVRGGSFPDERFHADLKQVTTTHAGQSAELPFPARSIVKPAYSASATKLNKGLMITIIAGAAILLMASLSLLWSNRSRNFPPTSDENTPSTLSTSPPNEPESPNDATPIPSEAPVQTSGSADFTDPKGVAMRLVPQGEFTMGSNADDALAECEKYGSDCDRGAYLDEEPPHTVTLDAFYIDTYEVTNALYAECVNASVCQPPTSTGSNTRSSYYGNPEFDDFPVIYVDWDMATTFCEWRGARLPTEAEWEKAARGTDARPYPWGAEADNSYANYGVQEGDTREIADYESGKSVYGLYDMAGNVWEWVADWYSDTYYQESPSSNPTGPDSGDGRVVRGGSWYDPANLIRTSVRNTFDTNFADNNFGIRCALDATP